MSEEASEGLEGLDLMSAIEAHVRWKVRLEAYINGTNEETLKADVVCRDDQCVLGKWIYSDGEANFGQNPEFVTMRDTHKEFHNCAGEVIRLVDGGETDEARKMLHKGDYAKYSHRIKSQLARLSLGLGKESANE